MSDNTTQLEAAPAPATEDLRPRRMSPRTRAFRDEVVVMMRKHSKVSPDQMLAVVAHVLGTAVAVQDPRRITQARIDAIIRVNMAHGRFTSMVELQKVEKLG